MFARELQNIHFELITEYVLLANVWDRERHQRINGHVIIVVYFHKDIPSYRGQEVSKYKPTVTVYDITQLIMRHL